MKSENKMMTVAQQIAKMNDDELAAVVAMAQETIENHRRDRRKAEVIAEICDLFSALYELDCSIYFVNGNDAPQELEGSIYDTGDNQLFIS